MTLFEQVLTSRMDEDARLKGGEPRPVLVVLALRVLVSHVN